MKNNLLIIVGLCIALVAAGGARLLASNYRESMAPKSLATGGSPTATLGQLNSFALGLLLGGLRGPLVMALWSSSESQKTQQDLEDFDTRVELIRLLQPQFDSVHLYQIWNKAYNVSVTMSNLASRYATILDAVDYGRRVLAERPANIDLETQLGEVFNNKLGGSQESDYYRMRIHEETQADEPIVKITFPATREGEFREAALAAGLSPRRLQVRRTESPTERVAAVRQSAAGKLSKTFSGADIHYAQMASRQASSRGVSGPLRMEPMLDEQGRLLDHLTSPRSTSPGRAAPGTFLDGSPAQFLRQFEPYPEGLSPHALAYNHFMKAWVLQNHAGQRHVMRSQTSIDADPGRALRDWAFSAFEEGRLLEAEAFGLTPEAPGDDGRLQARLELEAAAVPPDARPASPELLRQAMQRYERSISTGAAALEWVERHIETYPQEFSTFGNTLGRLRDLQSLVRADLLYDRLIAGDVPDRAAARREAQRLYLEAHRGMLDFIMRHHTPDEVLPPGVSNNQELLAQPIWVKWDVLERMRRERGTAAIFDHVRTLTEFDGYFERISRRLSLLRAQA